LRCAEEFKKFVEQRKKKDIAADELRIRPLGICRLGLPDCSSDLVEVAGGWRISQCTSESFAR